MNCDFILRLKIDVRKVEFLRKPVNIADMLKRCFIYNDSLRAGNNFLELCIKVGMKGEDLVFRIKLIFYDAFDLSCDLVFVCLLFGLLLVLTQCMVLGAIWGSKHFFLLLIKHGKQILSKKNDLTNTIDESCTEKKHGNFHFQLSCPLSFWESQTHMTKKANKKKVQKQ